MATPAPPGLRGPTRPLKGVLLSWIFNRYIRWRINDLAGPGWFVELDYPVDPRPRYGYGKPPHLRLQSLFTLHREPMRQSLRRWAQRAPRWNAIPFDPVDGRAPHWSNAFFTGLDPIALMGLLGDRRPALYLEVGSGNSTKFARHAIADQGLATRVVSVDPSPRAEIDDLCDEVIRQPFERLPDDVAERLGPGDVLFIDSSHRSFTNSDVTAFFLETLPALRPGVLVHLHDILLPYDYPPGWSNRYYSEQYLLAAYLLGGAHSPRLRLLWSSAFASLDAGLAEELAPFRARPGIGASFARLAEHLGGPLGSSIWLEVIA